MFPRQVRTADPPSCHSVGLGTKVLPPTPVVHHLHSLLLLVSRVPYVTPALPAVPRVATGGWRVPWRPQYPTLYYFWREVLAVLTTGWRDPWEFYSEDRCGPRVAHKDTTHFKLETSITLSEYLFFTVYRPSGLWRSLLMYKSLYTHSILHYEKLLLIKHFYFWTLEMFGDVESLLVVLPLASLAFPFFGFVMNFPSRTNCTEMIPFSLWLLVFRCVSSVLDSSFFCPVLHYFYFHR